MPRTRPMIANLLVAPSSPARRVAHADDQQPHLFRIVGARRVARAGDRESARAASSAGIAVSRTPTERGYNPARRIVCAIGEVSSRCAAPQATQDRLGGSRSRARGGARDRGSTSTRAISSQAAVFARHRRPHHCHRPCRSTRICARDFCAHESSQPAANLVEGDPAAHVMRPRPAPIESIQSVTARLGAQLSTAEALAGDRAGGAQRASLRATGDDSTAGAECSRANRGRRLLPGAVGSWLPLAACHRCPLRCWAAGFSRRPRRRRLAASLPPPVHTVSPVVLPPYVPAPNVGDPGEARDGSRREVRVHRARREAAVRARGLAATPRRKTPGRQLARFARGSVSPRCGDLRRRLLDVRTMRQAAGRTMTRQRARTHDSSERRAGEGSSPRPKRSLRHRSRRKQSRGDRGTGGRKVEGSEAGDRGRQPRPRRSATPRQLCRPR